MLNTGSSRTRLPLPWLLSLLAAASLAGCRPEPTVEGNTPPTPPAAETPAVPTTAPATTAGTPAPPAGTVSISMSEDPYQFTPTTAMVAPGATVTWTNPTDDPHTVTSDPGTPAGGPNSDARYPDGFKQGQTYTWTVPADASAGMTWHYYCRFHGKPGDGKARGTGMAGSLTVK
ncbi:MAG: hypothetical protein KY468_02095 [Armatimonadetes bacterium]|nr:hypothetical protein [Armatimonadota bacterium]